MMSSLLCKKCNGDVQRVSDTSWDDVTGQFKFNCKECGTLFLLTEKKGLQEIKEYKDLPEGVHIGDSTEMKDIQDNSVDLVVTSSPYNVDKEYETGMTLREWDDLLSSVMGECDKKMKKDSRACFNIVGINRKPYVPLFNHIINFSEKLSWQMRGIVLWMKNVAKVSTGWGSHMSASDPVLRDNHEIILVFQKGNFTEEKKNSGIFSEEFTEFTNAEWYFGADKASDVGHPAPFPDELVRRCVLLYTDIGDTVLDPFLGSATTVKVCNYLKRKGIGYEINEDYLPVIRKRLQEPLVIQSKATEMHYLLEAKMPDVADLSTSNLKKECERLGSTRAKNMNRFQLVNEYIRLKNQPSLTKYMMFDYIKNV